MKKMVFATLAVSTALGSATVAVAQDQGPAAPTSGQQTPAQPDTTAVQTGQDSQGSVNDVVVTARREAENLQNVPVSVQVVTGDTIKKLSITDTSEISKLAPGLTLSGGADQSNQKVVLRGVTWQPGSGTPATPIYFNEVPFDPQNTLVSIFDIGQIEVLRGPQGTSRGAPSISGAVTITTRKPDLDSFGGYVQGQYGEGKHYDVQGAINIPIISDKLAIRAAADIQDSQGNRVFSIHNPLEPKLRSNTYRISALLKPTDTISIEAMYQYRDTLNRFYAQVAGPGSPGLAAAGIPANFNGPALTDANRASVQDMPESAVNRIHLITLNATWNVLGHTLSYNFGRQIAANPTIIQTADVGNVLPGYEAPQSLSNVGTPFFQTQEIRLSSVRSESRPFDYDIGWFSKHSGGPINFGVPVFLTGAFGAPGTPPGTVTTPVSRYVLPTSTNINLGQVFDSFYGSVRFYLDAKTELSGGLSIVRDRVPVFVQTTTGSAATVAATLASLGGLPCAGIPGVFVTGLVNSNYPGFCDFQIASSTLPAEVHNDKYSRALYNFSLSHKFSDDLLAYATTGTSYRSGLPAINNQGLPANLLTPAPETATSYEVGVKSTVSRRLRVNADIFQINYKNKLTSFQNVPYYNNVTGALASTSIAFYRNIDARVRGAELEVNARPINDLSLGANVSYSRITSKGGLVPCNNPTGPAITAANPINFCNSPSGQTLNTQAPFQATVNGSYDVPVTSAFDGYFRFNVNYQGHNPNYGNFPVSGAFTQTSPYAIVDLFAGITGHRGAWDLGIYAKNVFDKQIEMTRSPILNNLYAPYASATIGYNQVFLSAPREIGATLRYSFGSR